MDKIQLRANLSEARATLNVTVRRERDRAIAKLIASSPLFRSADALLLYAPIKGEINLLPLIRLARERGLPVAFPRCDTETNEMVFRVLAEDAQLEPGSYRIPEPAEDAPLLTPTSRTLCLVPGLAFDKKGNRLGYGKGYYDRYLAHFPGVSAGIVYDEFLQAELPCEEHDRPVGFLITETRVIRTGDAPAKRESLSFDAFREQLRGRLFGGKKRALTGKEPREKVEAPDARPLHLPPLLVLANFLLLLLSRYLEPHFLDRGNGFFGVILLQAMIFLLPAAVFLLIRKKPYLWRLRLRPLRPEHLWFTLCMLILMISGSLLCSILTGGIRSLAGNFTLYETFVARTDGDFLTVAAALVTYALLPAVCEELVYRLILSAEYEQFGVAIPVTVSALFFAMLHFSLPLFLTYFFLGILLALALYATRSFLSVLILHFAYNTFCLFGQPYLSAFYVNAGSNEIFVFCLVVIFLLFAAFAAGEARKIYHLYSRANTDASYTAPLPWRRYPKSLLFSLLSPSVAVCILFWIGMLIWM